jgi:signal transduction histidine kinase/ligand-binding sensor domain-containing protein/CheY-like chemotaxis protein
MAAAWLAVCAAPPFCVGQRYTFQLFGQAEGLTNQVPLAVTQDRNGFLWVGTQNGLFRYDGSRFDAFGIADGLPTSRIASLYVDSDGSLLAATTGGVARSVHSRFQTVAFAGAPLTTARREGIATDGDGNVYLATEGGLAVRYNASAHSDLLTTAASDKRIFSVYRDAAGKIWAGCGSSLCTVEHGSLVRVYPELPEAQWFSIKDDSKGSLWLLETHGVWVRKPASPKFEQLPPLPFDKKRMAAPFLGDPVLELAWNGDVIVSTSDGLCRFDGRSWRVIDQRAGLVRDDISALFGDREGSIWIGIAGLGLARWLGYPEWQSWGTAEGLPHEAIWAIHRDATGTMWAGTSSGLAYARADTAAPERWSTLPEFASKMVLSLAHSGDNTLWIGTGNDGLYRLDGRTGRVAEVPVAGRKPYAPLILVDQQDRVWVTSRGAIYRSISAVSDGDYSFEALTIPGLNADETFHHIINDSAGRVWITTDHGLLRYEQSEWQWLTKREGLVDDHVAAITAEPGGGIWVGYRDALGISHLTWNGTQLKVEHHSTKNGLTSNQAVFMGADSNGGIWLGSDSGVQVLAGGWRHYGQLDGLIWDDCNSRAFFTASDGSVWIGTSRGLSRFERQSQPALPPPVVALMSARLGETVLPLDGQAVAPYSDRYLFVRFAAPVLSNGRDRVIRYRLSNVDRDWVIAAQNEARYANLSPGTYTFEVDARNAAGIWSAEPARLTFQIRAAWWQTWWFLSAVGLCAAAAGRIAWRRRLRHHQRQQDRLERAIETRTRELAAEKARAEAASRAKTEFVANISHEMRTPMNGVLGMTRLLCESRLNVQQREWAETALFSAESLLTVINDILDFEKIEAGKMTVVSEPFDLYAVVEKSVRLLRYKAEEKGLSLRGEFPAGEPHVVTGDAERVRQILVNYLANAIKFTDSGGVTVRVTRETENEWLLAVVDSGIGIPLEKHLSLFQEFVQVDSSSARRYGGTGLGLAICKRLAELMGGNVGLTSAAGEGATFWVRLPLPVAQEAALEPQTSPGPEPVRRRNRPLVLLVEDNHINQRLAKLLLRNLGCDVDVAGSGEETLRRFAERPYEAIFMDCQMPDLDGYETTARIRAAGERGQRVPIIATTASVMEGDRERCLAAGMTDYVSKPLTVRDLERVLDGIFARN